MDLSRRIHPAKCNRRSWILWFPDSTLNDGSIQTPDANPADNETYVVTVTDINNCSNNDTLFLEVHPNVPQMQVEIH